MEARKPPFDIRDHVEGSAEDDAMTQAVYDAINCLLVLVGDIPFSRLLVSPMAELVPHVEPKLDEAARYGLVRDPGRARRLVEQLRTETAKATLAEFFGAPRQQYSRSVIEALIGLRRLGIRLPVPAGHEGAEDRSRAIHALAARAPRLTLRRLFTEPRTRENQGEVDEYHRARRAGFLGWGVNNRCCLVRTGAGTSTCMYYDDLWCSMAGGMCAAGSSPCPGSPLP